MELICVGAPFTFEMTSKTWFLLLLVWTCGKLYAELVRVLLCPDNLTVTLQLSAGFAAKGIRMVYTDFLLIRWRALLCGFPQQWGLTKKNLQNLHPSLDFGTSTKCYFNRQHFKLRRWWLWIPSSFVKFVQIFHKLVTRKHTVSLVTSITISE